MMSERATDLYKKLLKAKLDSYDCSELAAHVLNLTNLDEQDFRRFLDLLHADHKLILTQLMQNRRSIA